MDSLQFYPNQFRNNYWLFRKLSICMKLSLLPENPPEVNISLRMNIYFKHNKQYISAFSTKIYLTTSKNIEISHQLLYCSQNAIVNHVSKVCF